MPEIMLISYLACALWSAPDEDLDSNFSIDDFCPEALTAAKNDCIELWLKHWQILQRDPSQAGHDFSLTRNHHGAGFWDRETWKPYGQELTDAAHKFGEVSVFETVNGLIFE